MPFVTNLQPLMGEFLYLTILNAICQTLSVITFSVSEYHTYLVNVSFFL
jgi:hypothetical protein